MEGRQYRGYYRGATKQVNQAVEAIHRAAERANATVTELVSTREPTSRRGHSSPTHTKQGHRGVPVAFWCSFYRLFNAAWIRSKERPLPRICMTVYRSGEFSFPVRARRRKPETSATVPG